jgi:cyclophilin family peptidyl-prolyl cis-trans isomerase/chitodextrinase
MNRSAIFCMFCGLLVSLGMTGESCFQVVKVPTLLRSPPAIIPTNPAEPTLRRMFSVDLRDYPETDRISWEFGDGALATDLSVSAGRTVTHDYARGGTFDVWVHLFTAPDLVMGRASRLLATGTLPVEVTAPNAPPAAAFVVEDVFDDGGLPLPLAKRFIASRSTDRDGSIESYVWDFGDGSHDEGEIVQHTFGRSSTRFLVRLTVTDDRGDQGSATRSVLANTSPVAGFTATEDPIDAMTFTFDASASSDADGDITHYRWNFGDDSPEESGMVVSHTYAVPDDYTVDLTVADEAGAVASTSQILAVTGTEPFIRSMSPGLGEVDAVVSDVMIDGENFETGASVRLERDGVVIDATSVSVESDTTIRLTLDFTGAEPGGYDVVVTNPDGASASLPDAFRVVTPNLVRLTTSMGDILLELVDDAPITTENFLQYVEDGFYDGTIFHRVAPDFAIQGGGFLPGLEKLEGLRDPIVNEFSADRSNVRGTVAMAKIGGDPDSATSQFFVNLEDNSENLDNQNGGSTVFATVIEGMDVVDAIAAVPLDGEVPIDDVVLHRAERE